MKIILKYLVAVTALSIGLAPLEATSQESGRILQCKAGEHTILTVTPSQKGTLIEVGFMKGSKPASEGLEPGTCAWPERAMGDSDSRVMSFFAEGYFVKMTISEHISSYQPVSFGPETQASELLGRQLWYWLDALVGQGDFVVHVQPRSGNQIMRITRVGP